VVIGGESRAASNRPVTNWLDSIEPVIADSMILPAYRVVHRVGADVTPMTVEIVLGKRRARSAKFDKFGGDVKGGFGSSDLGL
jgi:hypothetical protein